MRMERGMGSLAEERAKGDEMGSAVRRRHESCHAMVANTILFVDFERFKESPAFR